jgi:hypothetical protein
MAWAGLTFQLAGSCSLLQARPPIPRGGSAISRISGHSRQALASRGREHSLYSPTHEEYTMKNSNSPFNPQTIEPKAAPARTIPAREMTLEQFRQQYFPELVDELQSSTNEPAVAPAHRNAA